MLRPVFISLFVFFLHLTSKTQNSYSDVAFAGTSYAALTDTLRLNTDQTQFENSLSISKLHSTKKAGKITLGYSRSLRSVDAWYFPGSSDKKALVIGGMHGSELSSIEIAERLIRELEKGVQPYYSVVIIPSLFPDNASVARRACVGRTSNLGRYTSDLHADPNRQLPPLGVAYHAGHAVDLHGRDIEFENQLLLQLIQEYRPSRIVNLHAIKDETKAGFFADPRTDCGGLALGFQSDSTLATALARYVASSGGSVPGNHLSTNPTVLYHNDPPVAGKGEVQQRNLKGSCISKSRGYGVSLGSWATTAVCDDKESRPAMRLITAEFPGYRSSDQYPSAERSSRKSNIEMYAFAINTIFLGLIEIED